MPREGPPLDPTRPGATGHTEATGILDTPRADHRPAPAGPQGLAELVWKRARYSCAEFWSLQLIGSAWDGILGNYVWEKNMTVAAENPGVS